MKNITYHADDAAHTTLILPDNVLSFNTDTNNLHVHDGFTPGGIAQEPHIPITALPEFKEGSVTTLQLGAGYEDVVVTANQGVVTKNQTVITVDLSTVGPGTLTLTLHHANRSRVLTHPITRMGIKGEYTQLSNAMSPRWGHSVVAIEEHLYVFGGYDGSGHFNDLWRYTPETDQWQQLATGPSKRQHHAAMVVNGLMYIFGGEDTRAEYRFFSDLWSYNPQTDTWSQLASSDKPRCEMGATAIGQKLYIFGGRSRGLMADTYCYDTQTDTWQLLTPRDGAYYHSSSVVAINNIAYVFGGIGSGGTLNDLWSYNPQTDSWSQLSSGATARSYHTAVALNGKMLVFGGLGGNNTFLNDLWEYNPQTDTWVQLSSGATPRIHHDMVNFNNTVFLSSGARFDSSTYSWLPITDLWEII